MTTTTTTTEPTKEVLELRAEAVYIALKLLDEVKAYRWDGAVDSCTALGAKLAALTMPGQLDRHRLERDGDRDLEFTGELVGEG